MECLPRNGERRERTPGLLHGGDFSQIDKKFIDRLAGLDFKGRAAVVAIAFCQKVDHETQGGKYPKPIPFSPRDVASKGVSTSTFRRAMKHGEGKVWRCVKTGGGRFASHYEFLADWLKTPLPKKRRRNETITMPARKIPPIPYSR